MQYPYPSSESLDILPPDAATLLFALLTWLAGAGAGVIASWVQDTLIDLFPAPDDPPANRLARWAYTLLHAPRWKLRVSFALSIGIAALASGAMAFLNALATGNDASAALYAAVGVVIGIVANQVRHREARLRPAVWEGQR